MHRFNSILLIFSFTFNLLFPHPAVAKISSNEVPEKKEMAVKKVFLEKEGRMMMKEGTLFLLSKVKFEKKSQKKKKAFPVKKRVVNFKGKARKRKIKKIERKGKVKEMWVTLTAYSSTFFECDSSPFITASGTHVRDGVVAANFLPFGTKIKIPDIFGDKIFVVEDRMARRFHYRVDIWMPKYEMAKRFGVRYARIVIVK